MSRFIDELKRLNRKERYYLLRSALGTFRPNERFVERLCGLLGITPMPEDLYAAMDYHLNWIYAALVLSSGDETGPLFPNPGADSVRGQDAIVQVNQEDVDLIIAFEAADVDHLVMIEAKGVTSWSLETLRQKAERLQRMFTPEHRKRVHPHFLVTSPMPLDLPDDDFAWPDWMRQGDHLPWLPLPVDRSLMAVTRCNERGKPSAQGLYWTVKTDNPYNRPGGWVEGSVDRAQEHFVLTYGEENVPVAVLGKGPRGRFLLDYESAWNDLDNKARDEVVGGLNFLLIELRERDPWAYIRHHTTTMSNAYSSVHWGWLPEAGLAPRERRFRGKPVGG